MPKQRILGTTIESDWFHQFTMVPPYPVQRADAMANLKGERKFVTIEPILDFDVDVMVAWIKGINPEFVNIGADSKGHDLNEPPWEKVKDLIFYLTKAGIEIRQKTNLQRLKP